MRSTGLLIAAGFLLAACGAGGDGGPPIGPGPTVPEDTLPIIEVSEPEADLAGLTATLLASDLPPLTQATAPRGDNRVFALTKPGQILVIRDGEVEAQPFLDITEEVGSEGNEQGLLTLAFHPNFAANGRVFVTFTDIEGDLQLVEYLVSDDDRDRVDPASGRVVLEVPQPHQYHQSGAIVFGPDGYLWMSLGDGGGNQDTYGNGQDPSTIHATIIRLDIDAAEPYAIPPDNPFLDDDEDPPARPEVWAYGLRNPWRIDIDPETGLLYIADVGQEGAEEVNIVSVGDGGLNFGWPIAEGSSCLAVDPCDPSEFVLPVYEFGRNGSCAIIGGHVYRGATIPELHGEYFFADYCVGWIRSFSYDPDTGMSEISDWEPDLGRLGNITSLGTDGQGEILVSNLNGEVWRIEAVR